MFLKIAKYWRKIIFCENKMIYALIYLILVSQKSQFANMDRIYPSLLVYMPKSKICNTFILCYCKPAFLANKWSLSCSWKLLAKLKQKHWLWWQMHFVIDFLHPKCVTCIIISDKENFSFEILAIAYCL